jgi:thiol-disulfide isomerase/thioredoxin
MITSSLIALFALIAGPSADAPFQDIGLDQAFAAAKKDGRIVMIDFFTTWCAPCKRLDKLTWPDKDVQEWVAKMAVAIKLDAEKEVEIAKRYHVESYPTILFLKNDGSEIDRIIAFKQPAEFLEEAKNALAGKDAVDRVKQKMSGRESDPMERQKLGDAFVQKGKYPEALAEYLWCFDHGRDARGYGGVRLSFLLSDIVNLGAKYPPARQALEQRRDQAEAALASGKGGYNEACDLASVNQYLKTPERTLALYDRMHTDGKLTDQIKLGMSDEVLDLLLGARRYADAIALVGNAETQVKQSIAMHETVASMRKSRDNSAGDREQDETLKRLTVEEGSKYYEALLGAGQPKPADAVADLLIKFDSTGATFAELIEHAVRAGADDAARALVDRATKTLAEKELERVKLAASKIPAKK